MEPSPYRLNFEVRAGEPVTRYLRSEIGVTPFWAPKAVMAAQDTMTAGGHEVENPVRPAFLEHRLTAKVPFPGIPIDIPVLDFGTEPLDFSTFSSLPCHLEYYARTYFEVESAITLIFDLTTCGGAEIWVNGKSQVQYLPFARNEPQTRRFELALAAGSNEVVIYADELAERDTKFVFQLSLVVPAKVKGFIPLPYPPQHLLNAEAFLTGLAPEKDLFTGGDVILASSVHYPPEATGPGQPAEARVRFNQKFPPGIDEGIQDGDITEFELPTRMVRVAGGQINLGPVSSLPAAGLTTCEVGVALPDRTWITKNLTFALYNQDTLSGVITADSLAGRKKQALEYFASLCLPDINVGLAKLLLGRPLTGIPGAPLTSTDEFDTALALIAVKGDCADFVLTPLLGFLTWFAKLVPGELRDAIKTLALNFRYWTDEPGNDVMWFFSENHALLFHASQYLAGSLFPQELFMVSGRLGHEQREIGAERLREWFADFFRYGLAEWNSITYLPIDLVGFFALYLGAPDTEIRDLAKRGLDEIFELIAINLHHGVISASYGRVYEHNLLALPLGEITSLSKIAWGQGYFNNALRAAALFAMSDYEPPRVMAKYLDLENGESSPRHLRAQYLSGRERARTYLYKTADYSLGTAVNYRPGQPGYQQHLLNISLGRHNTQLWLNHPGEREYTGESRPSFWAGNGVMPTMFQKDNVCLIEYHIPDTLIDFVHLYFPEPELDTTVLTDNWAFAEKDGAYLGVRFSGGVALGPTGAPGDREVRSPGLHHQIVVVCGDNKHYPSFADFQAQMLASEFQPEATGFAIDIPRLGRYQITPDELWFNGESVKYHDSYQKLIEVGELT